MKNVAAKVAADGPYDAILILVGIGPYEPFDEELLKPLTPHLKIMGSASAGYNEFDVDWMTRNGIVFCNSRNAVNEATADMAILMILGILKDIQGRASSIAKGTWRGTTGGVLMPTRDPSGLKLGIIGMGAIGKVRRTKRSPVVSFAALTDLFTHTFTCTACGSQGQSLQYGDPLLSEDKIAARGRGCLRRNILLNFGRPAVTSRRDHPSLPAQRKDARYDLTRAIRQDEGWRLPDQYLPRPGHRRGGSDRRAGKWKGLQGWL